MSVHCAILMLTEHLLSEKKMSTHLVFLHNSQRQNGRGNRFVAGSDTNEIQFFSCHLNSRISTKANEIYMEFRDFTGTGRTNSLRSF